MLHWRENTAQGSSCFNLLRRNLDHHSSKQMEVPTSVTNQGFSYELGRSLERRYSFPEYSYAEKGKRGRDSKSASGEWTIVQIVAQG